MGVFYLKLDTTQIYTQVSIKKLKAIHEATHPVKCKGLALLGDELKDDDQVLLELLNLDNDEIDS